MRMQSKLNRLKAEAAKSVETIMRNWPDTEARADYVARQGDWRAHVRKPLALALPETATGALRLKWAAERKGGEYFIEDTAAAGLQFIGWTDELCDHIRHRGYYQDSDGHCDTLRGCVYRLPSRDGKWLFVPAYREGSTGQRRGDWTDTNEGSACVDLGSIDRVDIPNGCVQYWGIRDAARDAARLGDSMAERAAENEREHNDAWQAGSRWADLGEEIAETRKRALALFAEMRALGRDKRTPAICDALRRQIESMRHDIEQAREKREELKNAQRWQPDAFNDGAGIVAQ